MTSDHQDDPCGNPHCACHLPGGATLPNRCLFCGGPAETLVIWKLGAAEADEQGRPHGSRTIAAICAPCRDSFPSIEERAEAVCRQILRYRAGGGVAYFGAEEIN